MGRGACAYSDSDSDMKRRRGSLANSRRTDTLAKKEGQRDRRGHRSRPGVAHGAPSSAFAPLRKVRMPACSCIVVLRRRFFTPAAAAAAGAAAPAVGAPCGAAAAAAPIAACGVVTPGAMGAAFAAVVAGAPPTGAVGRFACAAASYWTICLPVPRATVIAIFL